MHQISFGEKINLKHAKCLIIRTLINECVRVSQIGNLFYYNCDFSDDGKWNTPIASADTKTSLFGITRSSQLPQSPLHN